MAESIFRAFSRDIAKAFLQGKYKAKVFNKEFILEHVAGVEWRVTDTSEHDIGLRFTASNGKLHFFLA